MFEVWILDWKRLLKILLEVQDLLPAPCKQDKIIEKEAGSVELSRWSESCCVMALE